MGCLPRCSLQDVIQVTEADPTKPYTPGQHNDRVMLREQCLCIAGSLPRAIADLDRLTISVESNQTFAAIRDMLSDVLTEIRSRAKPQEQSVSR